MCPERPAERRKHARYPLTTGVEFYHEPSHQDLPARCTDVSQGGLRMYVPVATPIRAGDSVRLTLGALGRPEFSGLGEEPLNASIVRVDRHALLSSGHLAVGVRFMRA